MRWSERNVVRYLVCVIVLLSAPLIARAGDPTLTVTHVAGTVHMISGHGGNVGVTAGPDGVILIDDDMEPVLGEIRAAIAALGAGDLRFIVNTHYHGDHVGNNVAFADEATIIAHENVRARLMNPGADDLVVGESGWPILTFDRTVTLHFNGEDIQVVHVPRGHTDGDAIVYFSASNVLHAGDQLFSGYFPFVDIEGGGTVDGFLANLNTILENFPADAKVIAGHGPLSTMADVRASRDMIVDTVKIVRAGMDAGKSLEELKAAGLPEKFDSFDWNFIPTERWIETIWNNYSK